MAAKKACACSGVVKGEHVTVVDTQKGEGMGVRHTIHVNEGKPFSSLAATNYSTHSL